MYGKFQSLRKVVGFYGMRDDGEVIIEFLFKLRDVSDVIDAFIKTAGEFWSDGLNRNALVGNGGEDDEHFRRGLRGVGFIHGDFCDEVINAALSRQDVVVDGFRFLGGFEKLFGGFFDEFFRDFEWGGDPLDADATDEFGMVLDEGGNVFWGGGFADIVSNIKGEEVAWGDETVDGAEVDVIGIKKVFTFPAEVGDGLVGGVAGALRFGADDAMLAVGFIPGRADLDAEFFGGDEGLELSVSAVGEAVTDAEGEFRAGFHRR